jgi:hypothetical protein
VERSSYRYPYRHGLPVEITHSASGARRISYCFRDDCQGRAACRHCRNIYSQHTRPRHYELTPEQRQRANCRAYANVYQRRGLLVPQPCEVCGSLQVEKHHDDYSKPLQVRWFCRRHHRRILHDIG